MAKNILTDINLNGNQIRNVSIDNVATLPSSPSNGRLVFLSQTDGDYDGGNIYFYDGVGWICVSSEYPFVDLTSYNEGDVISYPNVVEKLKSPNVIVKDGMYYLINVSADPGTFAYIVNGFGTCHYVVLSENSGNTLRFLYRYDGSWPIYVDDVLYIDVNNTNKKFVVRDTYGNSIDLRMNSGQVSDITLQFPSSSGTIATEGYVQNALVWTEWA